MILAGGATDTALLPGSGPDRAGADGQLLPAAVINPLLAWLLSDASGDFTGRRFVGKLWDASLPPDEAARRAMQPRPELPTILRAGRKSLVRRGLARGRTRSAGSAEVRDPGAAGKIRSFPRRGLCATCARRPSIFRLPYRSIQ